MTNEELLNFMFEKVFIHQTMQCSGSCGNLMKIVKCNNFTEGKGWQSSSLVVLSIEQDEACVKFLFLRNL
jgi:hypothetical protein